MPSFLSNPWIPLVIFLFIGTFAVRIGVIRPIALLLNFLANLFKWIGAKVLLVCPLNRLAGFFQKSHSSQEMSPLVVRIPELFAALILAWLMTKAGYWLLFLKAKHESVEIVNKIDPVKSALREMGYDPKIALEKLQPYLENPARETAAFPRSPDSAKAPAFADRWKEKFTRSKAAWVRQNDLRNAYITLAHADHLAKGIEALAASKEGKKEIDAETAANYFQLQTSEAPLPEDAIIILRKMGLSDFETFKLTESPAVHAMLVELLTIYVTRGVEEARLEYRRFTAVSGGIQYLTVIAFYFGVFLWMDRYFRIYSRIGCVAENVAGIFPVAQQTGAPVRQVMYKNPQEIKQPHPTPKDFEKGRSIQVEPASSRQWWKTRGSEVVTSIESLLPGASFETIVQKATDELDAVVAQMKNQLEEVEYRIFGWIAGVIPSLGFIGTVYGIAAALDKSGGLAQAQDMAGRSGALNAVTTELGVAFDTTLVALICGIILGAVGWLVERKELLVLQSIPHAYSKEMHT